MGEDYEGAFKGFYDYNGDGKSSLLEDIVGLKTTKSCMKNSGYTNGNNVANDDNYDLDYEDYEEEEEEDEGDYDCIKIPFTITIQNSAQEELDKLKEGDYPNKRRYKAAYELTSLLGKNLENIDDDSYLCYIKKRIKRCKFILENADNLVAANYLTYDGDFLYSQAIKDNFKLPVTLPDEDENREFELKDILKKIARKDIPLCLKIWQWLIDEFFPYNEYDSTAREDLTSNALNALHQTSNGFDEAVINYMFENPKFREIVIGQAQDIPYNISGYIMCALNKDFFALAKDIFVDALKAANGRWKQINDLSNGVYYDAEEYDDTKNLEYFEKELLPLLKQYKDGMILDEVEVLEEKIAKHKAEVKVFKDSRINLDNAPKQKNEYVPITVDFKTTYIYCGVLFSFSPRVYSYRTQDSTIKIGDSVIVNIGEKNEEIEGKIVSVGEYTEVSLPYPLEKTKSILRKN